MRRWIIFGLLEPYILYSAAKQDIKNHLERVIKELGLELNTSKLGNRYERYKDTLVTKKIQILIEVA
ncbi:hypothetical protein I8748_18345 [Nostoc sp. CENA67]|uniref:Uncharacterized protein n=1 Tax=Amazonocrinis nigriterrae CENA67 TaxID=2794033 RepID=A0A8J7HVM5_9NOST|nr:hypothetical protein [Amazonocrinis nigriterrae]MBH8564122.1 hypothetical protein [Amazonocrinis nigriterrae CENA67]